MADLIIEDDHTLRCPVCLGTDIREEDTAVRWNRIIPRPQGGLYISQSDPDWSTERVLCATCGNELDVPDDFFANAEWY